MSDPVVYRGIYVSNDVNGYAVLRCEFCPEWEYDVDGSAIEDAVKWANEHKRAHAEPAELKMEPER